MRISSLQLQGFGCLDDFACEPAPGLNVFFGENEAGKSTLQQAICALLYGFYSGDRALRDESARHERFRPWAGGPFRGSLEYELEDGRRYEVRRDFSTSDVLTQVIDATLGRDVSAEFGRGRHGNIPFARKHLGMSRGVFQSCAFISQGEIFDVSRASPSEIGDAIAALADSARRDVSAARAIDRLDAAAQRIGSDRARTADLPVAREKLARANAELRAADAARSSVAEQSARLDELDNRLQRLRSDAIRTEYLVHKAEAARLRKQVADLAATDQALVDARQAMASIAPNEMLTEGLRDQVTRLAAQLDRARETVATAEDRLDQAEMLVTEDDRLEYETLRLSVGTLVPEQVSALEAAAYRTVTPAAGGLAGAVRAAFHAIARAVTAVLRWLFRRSQPVTEPAREAPALSQAEAIAVLDRYRRCLELRPRIEALTRARREREAEHTALQSLTDRLVAAVRAGGVDCADADEAQKRFAGAWRARETYLTAATRAEDASRRRALLLNGRSPEELSRALDEHQAAMAELLAGNPQLDGCESAQTPEQLARALQQAETQRHACEIEATRLSEEVRLTLEACRPRAEIEEEVARWSVEVARLEKGRAAVGLAREAIGEAMTSVYRDFAPAVNTFLSEGIEAATDGRYRRAHVDPATLKVSLLVPEKGQVITDPPVSHGTRTLIYVLMRIGLAQHMSAIGEPVPLILDDPFVDIDATRLERVLRFLLGLSDRMQVFLFTKDQAIADWFRREAVAGDNRLHELAMLSTSVRL